MTIDPALARTTTTWDFENKTKVIALPTGVRNTMAYDPTGLRVELQESAGTKKFVYDGQTYLLETDGSRVTQAVYTNELVQYGSLISQRRGAATSWHHYDGLGSTRELSDAGQNITDTYLYDAWGNLLTSTGSNENPFRWIGQPGYYYDRETGLYYVRARTYQPTIARWTSYDPIGHAGGWNLFGYVGNRVVVAADPSGLICHWGPPVETIDDRFPASPCHECWERYVRCRNRAIVSYDVCVATSASWTVIGDGGCTILCAKFKGPYRFGCVAACQLGALCSVVLHWNYICPDAYNTAVDACIRRHNGCVDNNKGCEGCNEDAKVRIR